FYCYLNDPVLPSSPTRRSSDLEPDEVREVARDRRHVLDLPLRHELLRARATRVDDLVPAALALDREALELDRLVRHLEIHDQVLTERELQSRARQRLQTEPLRSHRVRSTDLQTRHEVPTIRVRQRAADDAGRLVSYGNLNCTARCTARVYYTPADNAGRGRLRRRRCCHAQAGEQEREAEQGPDASFHCLPLKLECLP